MDVSELLAQKYHNRAERSAADEPEITLTERELDHRIRKAFADRERNIEKQVRKLFDEHMREVEGNIADARAELSKMIVEARAELPRALTAADVHQLICDHFAAPARLDQQGRFVSDERKRWRAEIEKLRNEQDLRMSALLGKVEKLERGLNNDDGADVVDLMPRSRRA